MPTGHSKVHEVRLADSGHQFEVSVLHPIVSGQTYTVEVTVTQQGQGYKGMVFAHGSETMTVDDPTATSFELTLDIDPRWRGSDATGLDLDKDLTAWAAVTQSWPTYLEATFGDAGEGTGVWIKYPPDEQAP